MNIVRTLSFIILFSLPFSAVADDAVQELLNRYLQLKSQPEKAQQMREQGQERAQFCFRCHGEDGNSRRNYVPNLASQNPAYLFTQFEKFASGERENFVMSKLAPMLSAEERLAVALYFSDLPVTPRSDQPVADVRGMQIYTSLCFACHGNEGHGDQQYPRIAGQPYEFLENTLINFRNGTSTRKNSPMTAVISNLSENDLRAVASWVANMP